MEKSGNKTKGHLEPTQEWDTWRDSTGYHVSVLDKAPVGADDLFASTKLDHGLVIDLIPRTF